MAHGTIKWYNKEKGFGFISPDGGGRDLFFHATQIDLPNQDLQDGQRVEYEPILGRKGPEATHIKGII